MLFARNLSVGFTAGALGAVANVVLIMILAATGTIAEMGIRMPAPEPLPLLYRQVVWGGLWGLLLALPFMPRWWAVSGILVGLLASAAALFVFFPLRTVDGQGPGMAGLNAGQWMPALVVGVNTVWGLVAAWWYARVAERP